MKEGSIMQPYKPNEVLIIGRGRLGTELHKQSGWPCATHRAKNLIDLTDRNNIYNTLSYLKHNKDLKIVINAAANTNTLATEKEDLFDVNIKGVYDLVDVCKMNYLKLVHISTDYIYANTPSPSSEEDVPSTIPTWYCYSKLVSDGIVQAGLAKHLYLIIRTSFKEKPFQYKEAWSNIICNTDYTDVIASKIITLINNGAQGIYNVGSESKTIYDLAKQTKKDVLPVYNKNIPSNTLMDLTKLNKFERRINQKKGI